MFTPPSTSHSLQSSPSEREREREKESMEIFQQHKHSTSSKGFATQKKRARSANDENTIANNVVSADSMKSQCNKPKRFKRTTEESMYGTSEARVSVLERAYGVVANLDPQFPSMIKVMLPSHVSGGSWLGLPRRFCNEHLPKKDTMFVLEDEDGEMFETKYLVEKIGLSGGWRGFSISHKLLAGDVLVFHLVAESKFRVYIIRSNGPGEGDCSLGLIQLDAGIGPVDPADTNACKAEKENLERSSEKNLDQNIKKDKNIACSSTHNTMSDLSGDDSEDTTCEVLEGIRHSKFVVPFKEVKCMENFDVIVNDLVLTPEFSKHHLTKYYELCCSKNSYLHEQVLKGLNVKLVVAIIFEIINIADAIRACKITVTKIEFLNWIKTLQAAEVFGMNVGFLRERLEQLASIASDLQGCRESRMKRGQKEEEMRTKLAKLLEVNEKNNRIDSAISVKLKSRFKEVAAAPW